MVMPVIKDFPVLYSVRYPPPIAPVRINVVVVVIVVVVVVPGYPFFWCPLSIILFVDQPLCHSSIILDLLDFYSDLLNRTFFSIGGCPNLFC